MDNIKNAIDSLFKDGNLQGARNLLHAELGSKITTVLHERKRSIAASYFGQSAITEKKKE